MRTTFSRAVVHVPTWNGNKELPEGEQLKFKIAPVDVGVFNDLLEVLGRTQKSLTVGDIADKAKNVRPFADALKTVLPPHVESVGAALKATDDSDVSIQEIATLAPFVGLASELLYALIDASKPTELDVKN